MVVVKIKVINAYQTLRTTPGSQEALISVGLYYYYNSNSTFVKQGGQKINSHSAAW